MVPLSAPRARAFAHAGTSMPRAVVREALSRALKVLHMLTATHVEVRRTHPLLAWPQRLVVSGIAPEQ